MLTHLDHTLELDSVLSFHTAESFIGKYLDEFPRVIALYQLGIRPDLGGIGVELVCGIGGNTAIGCDLRPLICLPGYRRNQLCLSHVSSSFPFGRFALHFGANLFLSATQIISTELDKSSENRKKYLFNLR